MLQTKLKNPYGRVRLVDGSHGGEWLEFSRDVDLLGRSFDRVEWLRDDVPQNVKDIVRRGLSGMDYRIRRGLQELGEAIWLEAVYQERPPKPDGLLLHDFRSRRDLVRLARQVMPVRHG